MEYYIIGNSIEMMVQTKPMSWQNRIKAPSKEIAAGYPTTQMVKIFHSEQDALRYASFISQEEGAAFHSDKLKPIFKVSYSGDEVGLNWQTEKITFYHTAYDDERASFKSTPQSQVETTVDVEFSLVELSSLTRISGHLKNYGFYEHKERQYDRGEVNFQQRCVLF